MKIEITAEQEDLIIEKYMLDILDYDHSEDHPEDQAECIKQKEAAKVILDYVTVRAIRSLAMVIPK